MLHDKSVLFHFNSHFFSFMRVMTQLLVNKSFLLFLEVALQTHKGTENDIIQICSRLLKYAPDRKGGGGRKEN